MTDKPIRILESPFLLIAGFIIYFVMTLVCPIRFVILYIKGDLTISEIDSIVTKNYIKQ